MTLKEYLYMHEELEVIQHGLFKFLINPSMIELASTQLIRARELTSALYEYSDSYLRMGLMDLFYTFQRLEESLACIKEDDYVQRNVSQG